MNHKRLLVFNPETDFALASGLAHYTAPAKIRQLKHSLAFLPALYGKCGDIILIPESFSDTVVDGKSEVLPYRKLCQRKGIYAMTPSALKNVLMQNSLCIDEVLPWGWNRTIRAELAEIGINDSILPSDSRLETLRSISHRRTSIIFNHELNALTGLKTPLSEEFDSEDESMEYMRLNPGCYFKSPWSSSGRGVLVGGMLEERLTLEWIHGSIRRQGSVMAEKACSRIIDFATEWMCKEGSVTFLGFSLFTTTRGGSYIANVIDTQNNIEKEIALHSPISTERLLESQQIVIEKIVAPYYDGPLGIDGCASADGDFRPCLELNLRMTMGLISLHLPTDAGRTLFNPPKGTVGNIPIEDYI